VRGVAGATGALAALLPADPGLVWGPLAAAEPVAGVAAAALPAALATITGELRLASAAGAASLAHAAAHTALHAQPKIHSVTRMRLKRSLFMVPPPTGKCELYLYFEFIAAAMPPSAYSPPS
jgi:hypothetical protein